MAMKRQMGRIFNFILLLANDEARHPACEFRVIEGYRKSGA